jgi:hypothetical protein
MRTCLKALLIAGFCAAQIHAAPPAALAADLAVTPVKKVHKRGRVVRDYDGTPIVLRRVRPMVARTYDGTLVLAHHHLYEAVPVPRAIPRRYLNGQPVRPTDRLLYR